MQFEPTGHVGSPQGFRAAGVTAGIKPSGKPDLALVVSDRPAVAAGVFTTNRVHAYNVARNRRLLAAGQPLRGIAVTSGNANVATGRQGERDTDTIAADLAAELDLEPDQLAVAQTGVIGVPLPMDRLRPALPSAVAALSAEGGLAAAEAICTTDTCRKHGLIRLELGGTTITLGAMAKGAGMIHPNMATLLCFVTCDLPIAALPLQIAWSDAVDQTLNVISIDGDQSTSDTALILANGAAGGPALESVDDPRWPLFRDALVALLDPLAAKIAGDGEGAEKLVRVEVREAVSEADARLAARAVAASNLVKCAIHGNDPNWGRIACAVGYSGAEVEPARLGIKLNGTSLLVGGEPQPFDARAVSQGMRAAEVVIEVTLGLGTAGGRAYGCDLTEGYVRFNAEYTT